MAEPATRLVALVADAADDLLAYLVRRVPSPDDAADFLGEVLLALAARPDRIPADAEQARMWAFGIARTVLRAGRRRHVQAAERDERRTAALRAAARAAHPGDDADLERRSVRAAVRALPERDRELLVLVHWDGFSLEQAARHLRIPASTARSRHARAKDALRRTLDADPGADGAASEPAHVSERR